MTDAVFVPSEKQLTEEESSLRHLRTQDSYLEKYGFHFSDENYVFRTRKGLDAQIVAEISHVKNEPTWMTEFRLKAYEYFLAKPMPNWGGDMSGIDFDDIFYYVKASHKQNVDNWDELPDEIKQTFDKLGIPEAEQKFLAGSGAQFECLAGETRVYTSRGLVPIRDIQVGDTVFAYDEEAEKLIPAPVKATMPKGERQVYRVQVGTRTIRATDNHPFLVLSYDRKEGYQRGRYHREWKYLHELQEGDLVAVAKALPETGEPHGLDLPTVKHPNARYNPVNLPEKTDEDLMWLFGLYMGDGCIHRQGTKADVDLAIPESDPQLQAEVIATSERVFGLAARSGGEYRLKIGSSLVADYFEANGFVGNAHTKRVPRWVYELPQSQRLAFLGGYVDADGYVRDHAKNKDVILTSANPNLLEDMRELLQTCGISSSTVCRFESKHVHDKERIMIGYRLMVSGKRDMIAARSERRLERMGKSKYQHNYTTAKGTHFSKHTNDYLGFVRIDSITPDGLAEVYDIEVDGPHNFVAEGLIVHNSEVIYHRVREDLEKLGVIFLSMDEGLRQHPDLVKKYFGTVIPSGDNKFAALNSAVWSGGSFIYVPPGVHIEMPLQAYFRINTESMGQFERTLIIVDDNASLHYVEGCTAPIYNKNSLHSAVVEIIVHEGGRCRYTTIQNWSNNVYNLVTKRAVAYKNATMEWVDANLGCLAEGSTVTTPAGIKAIQDLNVGDEVLSYDEKAGELVFRQVLAKKYSGEQPIHTVSVGERQLNVTANHPFYSYTYTPDDGYRLAYVRADCVQQAIVPSLEDDLVEYPVNHLGVMEAQTKTLPAWVAQLPKTQQLGLNLGVVEVVDVQVSEASAELVPTWDIEVEGTGNFVSQGFIVHNSHLTMKYPAVHLMEEGAHGEVLSIAFAGEGQHQDAGAKIVHHAPNTTSRVISKSISKGGGRASYRGLLHVDKGATGVKSNVVCDALLLDPESRSDTYPYIEIDEKEVTVGHEASVSKIGEEQLFYLMSRGLSEDAANALIVNGFIEPLAKELPMEYSIELRKLIEIQLEGTIG